MQKPAAQSGLSISTQSPATLFGRFWRGYLRKHLWWIIAASALMIIEGSTLGLLSYMLQPMFDVVFVEGGTQQSLLVALAILALFLVRAVSGFLQRVLMTRISLMSSTELQVDLLGHTLDLDNGFHSQSSPGALIERVHGDVVSIQNMWRIIITGTGRDLVALVSLMVVAISIDWKWAAIAVVGAPLLLLPSIIVQRYIRRKSHQLREIAGRRTTRLDEIFHGITPIKLNRMEGYQTDNFTQLSHDWVRSSLKATAGQATVPGLVDIAVGIGFFCVMLYGGPQIASGEKSIGEFMSFFAAMSLAFQPLRRLADVAGYWQVMAANLARIFGLMDTLPNVKDTGSSATKLPKGSKITFENVSLAYGKLPVLNDLSFEVPEGTTAAFVGQSGAGKSTVFNVLTRLVDAQTGTIRIGDLKTSDLPLKDLRGLFSVVSQDALLFDETLRENIVLGQKNVSEDKLNQILDASNVSQFLSELPDGLDTKVGPRGSNLSGGQRQRVAIARALLRDTPILLLDEATSALDAESEKVVQDALDRLSAGRTTLIIAHRLSTIRDADQIIVLDKGRLVENGNHAELLARKGAYANLHQLQFRTDDPNAATTLPADPLETAPAVAILPKHQKPRLILSQTPLDALDWPQGRPDRLREGTISDMEPADHLILHAGPRAFLPRPFLRPNLSLILAGGDQKHLRLAAKHRGKFHRIFSPDPVDGAANARRIDASSDPAAMLTAL